MKNLNLGRKCESPRVIGFGLVLMGLSLVMMVTDILFASGLAMMVAGSGLIMERGACG